MNRFTKITLGAVAAVLISGLPLTATADHHGGEKKKDIRKPKDVHDVMEMSHEGKKSIVARVRDGKGSKEDLEILVIHYGVMAKSEPPRGKMDSWKKKTKELNRTIKNLQTGKANSLAEFKEASNCKACHNLHKPKDD
jgi:hypothetical protein